MEFTLTFAKLFLYSIYLASPLISALLLIIILLGQRVGKKESWTRFDALYWSFVTATTLGYGDFRPTRKISKILTVLITFTGIIFTGIIVAIALHSATVVFESHRDIDALKISVEAIIK